MFDFNSNVIQVICDFMTVRNLYQQIMQETYADPINKVVPQHPKLGFSGGRKNQGDVQSLTQRFMKSSKSIKFSSERSNKNEGSSNSQNQDKRLLSQIYKKVPQGENTALLGPDGEDLEQHPKLGRV